ncbi:Adenine nucleotide alpha hydrolases-like superfamily protein [Raphanus sativus]|uniref:Universal stress protein PHOS34-like isoform X2 n=1 Tax=Raphanus sativus TaxID=3726 RepID=A0A6J0LZK6_RAPSA|nr:universal stress protein PHOS34-like isoform X2 [Raphanus sativus]XP_018466018.1 universal stress protein PHOS34-like isoform X2 [Raphanus sativus]KAJ4898180.1 Adenine nucleotide alpha hydrolases-like superfamily protein [Raphanus sativus]KAJ4903558.1 Adenine nucleotide alpha hydrolases-like superfamily protein [Raphanus sativus]
MAEDQATAALKTSTVEKQPETTEAEPPRVTTTTKRMLVAIDESDSSFYALQWVIDHFSSLLMTTEAAEAEGDLLTVVHVQSPFYHFAAFPAGPGGATAVYASTAMIESVKKAQQETSAALLSRALKMCRAKQIRAETLVLEGDAKDMICQAVEQMHVDLLVVGSRGLGKIKRAFLGSVSDYCAHHAKCPILIVRPPKEITS